jgi:predicted phage terminase large subunit-like protein
LADGVTLGKVRVGKRDLPVVLGKDGRVRVGNFFADDVFREIQDRADAERSLHAYFKQAWGQIEGARPFVDSWHIGALCEHLEAVSLNQIRLLNINVPPRSSKSSVVSVAWPTWHWPRWPETRFGFASHDEKLAERDAVKARALIESRWYQNRFGDKFKINPKIDRQDKYANDKWGERIALGTASKLTGEGADIWVLDDANDAQDAMSEAKLEATRDWLDTVLSTRFNDPKSARFVNIQQRIHEKDATGHLQEKFGKDMVNLILPMEFEPDRRCVTVKLPSTGDKPWADPREEEGEPLCEARWGPEEIDQLKRSLRSQYAIAGQLQQRPAPAEGGMIKRSWFKLWQYAEPPKFECVLQSWDTATSEKEEAAYSACTTWGVFRDPKNQPAALLLSMWRDRLEYPELREMVKRVAYDYLDDETDEPLERPNPHNAPDIVLIESKSSGLTLIPDLMRAGIRGVQPFDPTRFGDKIGRVRGVTHLIQNGRVYLPTSAPSYQYPKGWAMEFVNQCMLFPKAESRDLVDTMTQALLRLSASGWVMHSDDPRPPDEDYRRMMREAERYDYASPY